MINKKQWLRDNSLNIVFLNWLVNLLDMEYLKL